MTGGTNSNNTRVLIVDTNALYRDILKKALDTLPDMDVIATAPNGSIGMIKIMDLKPEIILLDCEINDYSLTQFSEECIAALDDPGIILTTKPDSAEDKIEKIIFALESGAFDFIEKPAEDAGELQLSSLQRRLAAKIRVFSIKHYSRVAMLHSTKHLQQAIDGDKTETIKKHHTVIKGEHKLIVIGVSTGGPKALTRIIPELPANFKLPVVIVIHMPRLFTKTMADELNRKSALTVREAEDGDVLKSGHVYLARGGEHLKVLKGVANQHILLYDDGPPENGCKPAVDVLFRSAAPIYQKAVISVILTGMGEDGVKGMKLLKQHGAKTIAQDEETSVVWGMPGAAVKAGIVDEVLALDEIAGYLMETVKD